MSRKILIAAIAAAALWATSASAQNFGLQPTFGQVNLTTGFSPDPQSFNILAGGGIDAANIGGNCGGMIADAPDFRLNFTAGSSLPLIFSVLSSSDTTLAINDPSGQWFCDDDSGGNLNPLVRFNNPQTGQYDIWVGTFGGGTASSTLNISELTGGGAPAPTPTPAPVAGPNFGLQPTFGQVDLTTGFSPDPQSFNIVAGGGIDAGAALGGSCNGMIAEAPDFRLNFTAGSSLPLIFSVLSSSDTTLAINDPSGQWFCDDDSGGNLNPLVRFNNPQTGQYDIWVGTFGGGTASSTLNISELTGGGAPAPTPTPAPVAGPNFGLQPTFGQVDLTTGFSPDPQSFNIVAGGGIDAGAALGGSCNGMIAEAPDFRLNFTAGSSLPLIFSVLSSSDTTLTINDPSGQWFCDDDSGGNLNPLVRFNNPQTGQYDIWVGTFGGGTANATLNISEISGGGTPTPAPQPAPAPAPVGKPNAGPAPAPVPTGPNFGLIPTFGQVTLTTGFNPDPRQFIILAGGTIDANPALGGSCVGMIAEAPDFRLDFTAGSSLPLIFSVLSSSDTTLVINGPNGQWFCDDDAGGNLNPLVRFDSPQTGQYDVWIGTFGGGTADATLSVSEIH